MSELSNRIETELCRLSGKIVVICLRLQGGVGELSDEQRQAFQELQAAAGNFDHAMTGTITVPADAKLEGLSEAISKSARAIRNREDN